MPTDIVVVNMDIEGSVWPILNRWMADPEMAEIIDELFVEIHYLDPFMMNFGGLNLVEHSFIPMIGENRQMNWLKFTTAGNLLIILEEFIEYTPI